jgi:hypothetical protein
LSSVLHPRWQRGQWQPPCVQNDAGAIRDGQLSMGETHSGTLACDHHSEPRCVCEQVTMYGFGKMQGVQHHYHDTVHTVEYSKRASLVGNRRFAWGFGALAPVRGWLSTPDRFMAPSEHSESPSQGTSGFPSHSLLDV